jgi:uncharacterized OsmC-like protein
MTTTVNGIDTEQAAGFAQLLVDEPSLADVTVRARHTWQDGYGIDSRGAGIVVAGEELPRDEQTVTSDRPSLFGGGDGGCVPAELLLAALASCVGSQFVEHAALRGVELTHLEIATEGRVDLRGTLDGQDVPAALQEAHLEVEVASSEDGDVLAQLLEVALRTSPVAATLRPGVALHPSLRHVAP